MIRKFASFFIIFALSGAIFNSSPVLAQIPSGAGFWLKADTGVTVENGVVVSEWKDQSGTSKSAFQSLPISQPTFLATGINNLPAIHFDGRYNYMDCAPIFPVSKDYTVTIVARISDFFRANNLFSGNRHAINMGSSSFPTVQNDTSPAPKAVSTISLSINQPAIITISYRQSNRTGAIYVNGDFADSAVIGANTDPKLYLGAFQGISSFYGDLAEIVLYSKVLSKTERKQLEAYLFKKYDIQRNLAPDSIYTAIPKHLQFYPRDEDDSATVSISGSYYEDGYDSIYLMVFMNNAEIARSAQPLNYLDGKALFAFAPRIHAELSEYTFLLAVKSSLDDRRIAFRDSIVCGDVLLINGQSNSINNNLGYTSEFYRTFGLNQSLNKADTLWAICDTITDFGGGAEAGSWGIRLQELIANTYRIPSCVINGGAGGATIEQHLRDPLNHTNLLTLYGQMLYRVQKSHLAAKAKALFWYQGESDIITNYNANFQTLYNAWKEDYPNVVKIYVMQIRPGCSLGFTADVRDLQRTFPDAFGNIKSVSTMGLPGHGIDSCHFTSEGYLQLGDQLFSLLARDFYGSADNSQIASPNIHQAYYTNSAHTAIGLTFLPEDTRFALPADTTVKGIVARLMDYFYLNDTGKVVQSMSTTRNRIFLELKQPSSARFINYLPDKYYDSSFTVYEGPWLKNTRNIGAFSFYHFPIIDSAQAGLRITPDVNESYVEVYPNPSDGKFTVRCQLPQDQHATITISDLLGRIVASKMISKSSSGEHEEIFDIAQLGMPKGAYLCRLQSENILRETMLYLK